MIIAPVPPGGVVEVSAAVLRCSTLGLGEIVLRVIQMTFILYVCWLLESDFIYFTDENRC